MAAMERKQVTYHQMVEIQEAMNAGRGKAKPMILELLAALKEKNDAQK